MENEGALDVSFAGGCFQRRREQCTITAGFGNLSAIFEQNDLQKSTLSLLYVSSAIAVVLWLLATLLQGGLRPDLPVPAPRPEPAQETLRQANSPAEERLSLQDACTQAESEIRSIVSNARQCTTDDDCTLFDYGYPIDCMTSVAKSEIVTLREGFRKYGESCEHRVFFDCPTEPFVRLPVCKSGRCEVDLVDPRNLQDETLEQLEKGQ